MSKSSSSSSSSTTFLAGRAGGGSVSAERRDVSVPTESVDGGAGRTAKSLENYHVGLGGDVSFDVRFVGQVAVQSFETGSRVDVTEFHFYEILRLLLRLSF